MTDIINNISPAQNSPVRPSYVPQNPDQTPDSQLTTNAVTPAYSVDLSETQTEKPIESRWDRLKAGLRDGYNRLEEGLEGFKSWVNDKILKLRGDLDKADEKAAAAQTETENKIKNLDGDNSPEAVARREQLQTQLDNIKAYRAHIQELKTRAEGLERELNDKQNPVSAERAAEIAEEQAAIANDLKTYQAKIEEATGQVLILETQVSPNDTEAAKIIVSVHEEAARAELEVTATIQIFGRNILTLTAKMDIMTTDQRNRTTEAIAATAITARDINASVNRTLSNLELSNEYISSTFPDIASNTETSSLIAELRSSSAISESALETALIGFGKKADGLGVSMPDSLANLIKGIKLGNVPEPSLPESDAVSYDYSTSTFSDPSDATYSIMTTLRNLDDARDARRTKEAKEADKWLELDIEKMILAKRVETKKMDQARIDKNRLNGVKDRGNELMLRLGRLKTENPSLMDPNTALTQYDIDRYKAKSILLHQPEQNFRS
jgi:hypothetical protein